MVETIHSIRYQSDTLIRLRGPIDVENELVLTTTDTGATCSFKVYDISKVAVLTADEITAATVLNITYVTDFEVGDIIEVVLDDETTHDAGVIISTDVAADTITVTIGLAGAASTGNGVRVRLGAVVTMTEYNQAGARIGSLDWGFRGTLADTHPGIEPDMLIDIEIRLVGSPGGGLDRLDTIHAKVIDSDCH